ncbi:uncharacterized protein LOC128195301 [Vigna angularis]|uniref:uncharacterized protein LOC128195301 n=1 Tax=Phaseolus angularis TaxID=3914 RepID=UPI0022B487AD|nr:uncharacterized protein LOC128195301 [Vigna angularis]
MVTNELKMLRDEQVQYRERSMSGESQGEQENLRVGDYYPSSSRRHRRDYENFPPPPKEVNVVLPHFHGKDNIEAYLDWEMKVEQIFACQQVSEERKVSLATLSFQGYAMYWWTALVKERLRQQLPPIKYWNELTAALKKRHIPSYYKRELMDKLQRLQQKSMSVEGYRQQMELYIMRAGITEAEETTLARFLSGLNLEIRDKVEQQNQRKISAKRFQSPFEQKFTKAKEPLKPLAKIVEKPNKESSSHTRTSDIKCFKCLGRGHIAAQCPTKRTILLKGKDIYSSESESPTSDSESETEKEEEVTRLVEKLNLAVIPHPKPYRLHWLNEDGDITVKNQVKVALSIGNFKDEVVCDVVPMEAFHVLLGRPWQFDHNTIHHGLTNTITVHKQDKKFVLQPLTPTQVAQDQAQMKSARDQEKKQKKKKITKQKSGEKEVIESSVPSYKVTQHEVLLNKKTLNNTLQVEQPSYLLLCQGTLTCTSSESQTTTLSLSIQKLLKEFDDLFPKEIPNGLPPLRGIEHQIDFIPGATLPNRPAYRTNPQETKEIESQVQELLDKGLILRADITKFESKKVMSGKLLLKLSLGYMSG